MIFFQPSSQQIQQMLKESRKALSLQLLNKHHQRVKGIVSFIENYRPSPTVNKQYIRSKRIYTEKKQQQNEKKEDKLWEDNMKLIYRIETTGHKVDTKKFPTVNIKPKRLKSLTQRSYSSSRPKFQIKDVFRNQDELFEQNIKIITNIECTGPKISCWTSKKAKQLNQLVLQKKRDDQRRILDKYREITKEFTKINKMKSFKRSTSISSINSKSILS